MKDPCPSDEPLTHGQLNDKTRSKQSSDYLNGESWIIRGKPIYPQYASLETRIRSFNNTCWTEIKPDIQEMARSGFIYNGHGDFTRCYFCGIGFRNWQPSDCPWKQHALLSPMCGHIRRCRRELFVNNVRLTYGEATDTEEGDQDEETHASLRLDSMTRMARSLKLNTVAVEAAREFIESDEKIRDGVYWLLSRDKMYFSATELVEAIEECSNDGNRFDETGSEQRDELCRENERFRQPVSCKICMDAMASVVVVPCGHLFSCPQCIAPLRNCAVCRAVIKGTVRATLCTFNKDNIE